MTKRQGLIYNIGMKIFIASDLHGSAEYCRQLIEAFNREQADKLLLLGDVLYHGPRNDLPENYSPREVLGLLEGIKNKIICVSGNCDAEIDKEILPFPVISDFGAIFVDGLNIYFAHGHRQEPPLLSGDVYLTGHTHVPLNAVENGHYHLGPGSLSIPKEDSRHGYIVYENRKFTFKDLSGEVYDEVEIKQPEAVEEEPVQQPLQEETVHEETPVIRRPQVIRKKIIVRRR